MGPSRPGPAPAPVTGASLISGTVPTSARVPSPAPWTLSRPTVSLCRTASRVASEREGLDPRRLRQPRPVVFGAARRLAEPDVGARHRGADGTPPALPRA